MSEHLVDRFDATLSTILDARDRPRLPASIEDVALLTVPVFGTLPYRNLEFDSTVGAVGITDVETTPVPEGEVHYVVAGEISHNDGAGNQNFHIGLRWDRAAATTSIALHRDEGKAANLVVALIRPLYLGPTMRIYGRALAMGAGAQMTLKVAFLRLLIGETAPSP